MKKHVFVLSRQTMFRKGIESLLSQDAGIEIVSQDAELSTAVECIQNYHPDVVIVNCDDPDPAITPAVLCIIRERLGIRVIGLSLKDNEICVYKGEAGPIHQIEDLLRAIQD